MAQTATYTMEAFIEDVKRVFASSKDPLVQAQGVAEHMKDLLATPGWLDEKLNLPDEGGYGQYTFEQLEALISAMNRREGVVEGRVTRPALPLAIEPTSLSTN